MSEVVTIAEKILEANENLDQMRAHIKTRSEEKAKSIANYDKLLALTMIQLRNGKEMIFEGETIKDPPTTIIEKIAKGMCWKERLAMDQAEAEYKSLITNIETLKAQLNGYQSINRHLD
jgi:hypothetical protein